MLYAKYQCRCLLVSTLGKQRRMKHQNPSASDDVEIMNTLQNFKGIYIIDMNLEGAGFGAMMLQTLNQIRYCERHNYLPVVNYNDGCKSPFFDATLGDNMWDQYFAPLVHPYDYTTILSYCHNPNHPLSFSDLVNIPDAEMLKICEHHNDSIYPFTFADWRDNPPDNIEAWYQKQRNKGHETLSRYIRIKPEITYRVELFWNTYLKGYDVLGVHIRGTDLMYAPPVSPAEYFEFIDNWLKNNNNPKVFVATDQYQYLTAFQARYGDTIVACDCSRSTDEVVPFNMKDISAYKKGTDVLMDMLMLSRTRFLIKGTSNVGEFAMYINPDLKCLDLSICKQFAFGQDYGKGWNGVLASQTKPAWTLLKNTDLSVIDSNAKTQNRWQAIRYKLRPYYSPPIIFSKRIFSAVVRRMGLKRKMGRCR